MAFESYGKVEIFWIVPELNRKRFYCISVEPGLFGPVLVRSWGRIGEGRLRRKEQFFSERKLSDVVADGQQAAGGQIARKGYCLHSPLP